MSHFCIKQCYIGDGDKRSNMAYQDDPAPQVVGAPPATVANLLTHFRKFGLDNANTGYKGKAETYAGYSTLRADALVHVARTFLTEDAYVQLLEGIGYGRFEDAARADWRALHEKA
jgi:hypothetical protein